MTDRVETLLKWKQNNTGAQLDSQESDYIKRIIKELADTFPCEWAAAVREMEEVE